MTPITPRQSAVLAYIRSSLVSRGYPPTVREIGAEFGIQSPNGVWCHLKALEKKKLIVREAGKSRAIRPEWRGPHVLSSAIEGTGNRRLDSHGPYRQIPQAKPGP